MGIDLQRIEKLKITVKPKEFLTTALSLDGQELVDFISNDQNWIGAFGTEINTLEGNTAPVWENEKRNIPWWKELSLEESKRSLDGHFNRLLDNIK